MKNELYPDVLLMDGNFSFSFDIPYHTVKAGDSISVSISSASIIAKVERDIVLNRLNMLFPGYGFDHNKGYGTKEHRDAIITRGVCPIHRKSYEPVKSLLEEGEFLF